MRKNFLFLAAALAFALPVLTSSCNQDDKQSDSSASLQYPENVVLDTFADLQVLYYELPGWEKMDLRQKTFIYYLSEAALAGRDIIYDQHCAYNLSVRKTLEAIYDTYSGDRNSPEWQQFMVYAKRVWFSNGIHHHYNEAKILPEFSRDYFAQLIEKSDENALPLQANETPGMLLENLTPVVFDPTVLAKRTNKDKGVDVTKASAVNFYKNISAAQVEQYYADKVKSYGENPPLVGLNSRLVYDGQNIFEEVWKAGEGNMYGPAISKIVENLEKALPFADNDQQKTAIRLLIDYYQSGDLKKFDEYNIAWVKDTASSIDFINGFIEVYHDPLGFKGDWEAVVQYNDPDATEKMAIISKNAQYFEDNSPIMDEHKKASVKGVSYRVINVAMEGGDCAPHTPIGINLPNSNWIREQYGSKSISLNNIENAYSKAGGAAAVAEFAHDQEEIDRVKKYGEACGKMHTALHEVIGHASGKLNPGVSEPHVSLKQYSSTLEEARADLVALYFMPDPKLVEWGVMPDGEAFKAEYDNYIRNGLLQQLRRIHPGDDLEEDHMRNRQLVAAWAFEKGKADKVILRVERDGKTFYDIQDYNKLRDLFGQLLREIQRIKSTGDYTAANDLVEAYGVKVDPEQVKQVRARYAVLPTKPYSGFVQPRLVAQKDKNGNITEVKLEFEGDFVKQMMRFGKEYSFLK